MKIPRFFEHHKPHFDEVVASDDCSSDNSVEIVKKYADKYIISDTRRFACEYYRQRLADLASNDWVFMMDSDQFIDYEVIADLRDIAKVAETKGDCFLTINIPPQRIGCKVCPKGFAVHNEPKFANKKFIRWSEFPHCGLFYKESYRPGWGGAAVGGGQPFGKVWHLCTGGSAEKHTIDTIVRQYRWIDYAKNCIKDLTGPEYAPDRKRCIDAYTSCKLDIVNMPYQMSEYLDNCYVPVNEEEAIVRAKKLGGIK
jgi:glycosyltransferase involved in cell wall biosynthesis